LYFIDVQGTLISDIDKTPIRGSIEFVDALNKSNTPYMVVTNNTKKQSRDFYNYLQSIGFDFGFERYLDPLMVLSYRVQHSSVAAYGSEEFLQTLLSMGYNLEYKKPDVVLIAIKEDFTSEEYAQMIELLLGGAKLVGMHETSIYAKNNRRYPGVGAILKLLEFAASVDYEVIGKPSVAFYQEALRLLKKQNLDIEFEDITMISDDVKGDLGGAKELGMNSVFVTSGKYRCADEIVPSLQEGLRPDFVYKDMQEILERL